MPNRIRIDADLENTAPAEAYVPYGGRTPPPGVFRCIIRTVKYGEANRAGDAYYTVRLVIAHDAGAPKARFNGFSRTWNGNISKQGLSYLRQFADAAGFTPKEIKNPLLDDDGEMVLKWGNKEIEGVRVKAAFRNGKPYKGQRQVDVSAFFPDEDEIDGDDVVDINDRDRGDEDDFLVDDVDDFGDDAVSGFDEFAAVDAGDDDEFVDDEGGAAVLEDDTYDDEPEPEPTPTVRRPPAKKAAPAKAAGRRTTKDPF